MVKREILPLVEDFWVIEQDDKISIFSRTIAGLERYFHQEYSFLKIVRTS